MNAWAKVAAAIVLIAVGALAGDYVRGLRSDAQVAKANAATLEAQRDRAADQAGWTLASAQSEAKAASAYAALALQMNQEAATYAKEKANAKASFDRTVAALRDGTLRLQDRWATERIAASAATSAGLQPAAAGSGLDGRADDRAESAGRIVLAADECDAQVRGLQQTLRAERASR